MTAANLIHEIVKTNPGCPILLFFRQIIEANREPQALLWDWMDQRLDYSLPLNQKVKTYVECHLSLASLSMKDPWRDLQLAFAGLLRVYGNSFCSVSKPISTGRLANQ